MVYRRALRGALWLPLQSKLWRELRAPSPDGHGEPPSRVVQLRDASLLHHDGEQRGNDVLVLSCGVRQHSSTFCVSSVPLFESVFMRHLICIVLVTTRSTRQRVPVADRQS